MAETNKLKTILAIETSCDETAGSILEMTPGDDYPTIKTLSSVVKSQIKLHSKMGGVVPEVAARAHIKNILPVVKQSLVTCNLSLIDIDYIAVTKGPGLIPSLLVGVEFAKALSLALNKPIIPVNHMLGHLYSPFARLTADSKKQTDDLFPNISLIVSGGHTMLVLMKNVKEYKVLGQTVDDAAGEAFDKVAKLLKLPYPGGPEVSKLALNGKANAIAFPRPMINAKNYNFSFSGLKTAVLYYVQSEKYKVESRKLGKKIANANLCKSFQEAVVDVLVTKTMRAVKEFGAKSISLSGGVAANSSLREQLKVESDLGSASGRDGSKKLKVEFFVPPMHLCTDNAEMIGLAAAFMLHNDYKPKSYRTVQADPNLAL